MFVCCIATSCTSSQPPTPASLQTTLVVSTVRVIFLWQSEVTICIQILQSDGGNTMAAINAGTLALIDAGIAMKDYVVACTAANLDGTAVCDANQPEANAQGAELMVALLPKSGQVVSTQMSSRIHVDHFEPLLALAQQGCRTIYDTPAVKRAMLGVVRDIRGILRSLTSKPSYSVVFEFLYPTYMPVLNESGSKSPN